MSRNPAEMVPSSAPTISSYLRGSYPAGAPYQASYPAPSVPRFDSPESPDETAAPEGFFSKFMKVVVRIAQVSSIVQTATAVFSQPPATPKFKAFDFSDDSPLDGSAHALANYPAPSAVSFNGAQVARELQAAGSYSVLGINPLSTYTAYANTPTTYLIPATAFTEATVANPTITYPAWGFSSLTVGQSNLNPLPSNVLVTSSASQRSDVLFLGSVSASVPSNNAVFTKGISSSDVAQVGNNYYAAREGAISVISWPAGQAPSLAGGANLSNLPTFTPSGEVMVSYGNSTTGYPELHVSGNTTGGRGAYGIYQVNSQFNLTLLSSITLNVSEVVTKIMPASNFSLIFTNQLNLYGVDTSNGSAIIVFQLNASFFNNPLGGFFQLYDVSLYSETRVIATTSQSLRVADIQRQPLALSLYPSTVFSSSPGDWSALLYNQSFGYMTAGFTGGAFGFCTVDLSNPANPQIGSPILFPDSDSVIPAANIMAIRGNLLTFFENNVHHYRLTNFATPSLAGEQRVKYDLCPSLPYPNPLTSTYTVVRSWLSPDASQMVLGIATQTGLVYNCFIQNSNGLDLGSAASVIYTPTLSDRGNTLGLAATPEKNGSTTTSHFGIQTLYRGLGNLDLIAATAGSSSIGNSKNVYAPLSSIRSLDGDVVTVQSTSTSLAAGTSSSIAPLAVSQISYRPVTSSDFNLNIFSYSNTTASGGVQLNLNPYPPYNDTLLAINPYTNSNGGSHVFDWLNASTGSTLASYDVTWPIGTDLTSALILGNFAISFSPGISSLAGNFSFLRLSNVGSSYTITSLATTSTTITTTPFFTFTACSPDKLFYINPSVVPQLKSFASFSNISDSNCRTSTSVAGYSILANPNNQVFVASESTQYKIFPIINGIPFKGGSSPATYNTPAFNQAQSAMRNSDAVTVIAQNNVGISIMQFTNAPGYSVLGTIALPNIGTIGNVFIPDDNQNLAFVSSSTGILVISLASTTYPALLYTIPMPATPSCVVVKGAQAWVALADGTIRTMSAPGGSWLNTHAITVTAPRGSQTQGAQHLITLNICDAYGNCLPWVNPWSVVNRAPVFNVSIALQNQTWPTSSFQSYVIASDSATVCPDLDGDTVSYSAQTGGAPLPAFLSFSSGVGLPMQLSGTFPPQNIYTGVVQVTGSDGHGGLCSFSFSLSNPFAVPTTLGYSNTTLSATSGQIISNNGGWVDPNGYPLMCEVVFSGAGIVVTVDPTSCFPTVATRARSQGIWPYQIRATKTLNGVKLVNPAAATTSTAYVIYQNTPPAIPSTSLASAEVAVPYNAIAASASDVDGDFIAQSMAPLPTGLTYDNATGAVIGTPGPASVGTTILTRQASDPYSTTTAAVALIVNDPWLLSLGQATVTFIQNTPYVAAGSLVNLVVSGSSVQPRSAILYLSNTVLSSATLSMSAKGSAVISGNGTSALSVAGAFSDITASAATWGVNPTAHSSQAFTVNALYVVNGASVLPKSGSVTFLINSVSNPLAVIAQSTTPFISTVPGAINSGVLFSVIDYDGDTVTMNCTIINLNGLPAVGFNISTTVSPVSTQPTGIVYGGTYQLTAPSGAQGTESATYALICDAEAHDPSSGQLIPGKAVRSATTPIIISDAAAILSGTAPVGAIFYPGHNTSFAIPSAISTVGNVVTIQALINGAVANWVSVIGNIALSPMLALAPAIDAASSYTVTLTYHNNGRSTKYDQSVSFGLTRGTAFSVDDSSMSFLQNQAGTFLASFAVSYAFGSVRNITARISMQSPLGTLTLPSSSSSLNPSLILDATRGSSTTISGLDYQINPYLLAPSFGLKANNPSGAAPYIVTGTYQTDSDPLFSVTRAVYITHVPQQPYVAVQVGDRVMVQGSFTQIQIVPSQIFSSGDVDANIGYHFGPPFDNSSNLPAGIWNNVTNIYGFGSNLVAGVYSAATCSVDSNDQAICAPFRVTVTPPTSSSQTIADIVKQYQSEIGVGSAAILPTYKFFQLIYFLIMHAIKGRTSKTLLGTTKTQRDTWKTEHLEQILTSLRLTTIVIINLMIANYAHESATAAASGTTEDAADDTTDDSGSEYESLSSPEHAAPKTTKALKHGKLSAKRDVLTRPGPIEESILVAYAQSTLRSFLKHIMKEVNKDRIGSSFGEKIRYLNMLITALSYSDPTKNSIPRAFEEDIINYLNRIGALIRSALIDEDADNETRELAHLYLALTHYLFFIKSYQNREIAIGLLISLLSNLLATPGLKKSLVAKTGEALYYALPCTERPEPLLPAGLNLTLNTTVALLSRFPSDDTAKRKFNRLFGVFQPGHMVFTPTARLWEDKVERLRFMAVLALQNKGFLLEILKEYLAIPDDQPHLLKSYEEILSFIFTSHDLYHSAASSGETLLRGARTSLISAAAAGVDATKALIQMALELRRRSFFISNKELLPCLEDAILKRKGFSDVRSSLQKLILEYQATYNESATSDSDFNEDCKILYIIALKRIAQLPQFETRAAASNALAEKRIAVAYGNVFTLRTTPSQVVRKKIYKSAMVLFPSLAVIRTPSKNTLANMENPMRLSSSSSVHSTAPSAAAAPRNALVAQQLLTHFGRQSLTPGARVSGVLRTVVTLPKAGRVAVTATGAGALIHRTEGADDDRTVSAPVRSKSVRGGAGLWAGRAGKTPLVSTQPSAAEEAKGGVAAAGEGSTMVDNPLPGRSSALA